MQYVTNRHIPSITKPRAVRLALSGVVGALVLTSGVLTARFVMGQPTALSAAADRIDVAALPAPPNQLTAASSVEEVAAKMMRTNAAYRTFSARLSTVHPNGQTSTATLAVAQPDRYRIELTASDGQQWRAVSNGEDVWVRDPRGVVEPRKNTTRAATTIPQTDPRPDRIIVPVSGTDLPIGGAANTMLHPHGIVQGTLPVADAKIAGMTNIGGREGVVLELLPNPDTIGPSQRKFGSRRVYVIDAQTGIVLREEIFGLDGRLTTRNESSGVSVDAPDFAGDFELRLAPGERLMTPEEVKAALGGPPQG